MSGNSLLIKIWKVWKIYFIRLSNLLNKNSHIRESNPWPFLYETTALPTELKWHSNVFLGESIYVASTEGLIKILK